MHFSEEELRAALKRKDPGEGFTQRVIARVNQARAEGKTHPARKPNGTFLSWWKLHPVWAFAVAAVLLFSFAWGGYQYSEYRHGLLAQREQQRLEQAKRDREQAEQARDEAIQALEIARSKLNHVLERAQLPLDSNDKIRRQRL
ncbi:MAG TPA: hypothetical protein VE133_06460 [Candidatus Sulfotelmatobacter sp.]|nr:hypothetical protein [Candidatus Sulfotelmatobacter sp.]